MVKRTTMGSALLVLLAGVSYGVMAPIIKGAYAAGFTWAQSTAGQATFGTLLFVAAFLVQRARGQRWQALRWQQALKLMGTGLMTCCTTVLYCFALSRLTVAVALTMLFQFTWIGIVIQVIATRRAPSGAEVGAAAVIVAGTVFASGLFPVEEAAYDPLGIACGLGAALTCALFVFLSSRVETQVPPMQRGILVCLGACVLAYVVAPTYLFDGTLALEAPFGLLQGLFALMLPVLLFGLGGPHLPTGIVTILSSAELPTSIILSWLLLGEVITGWQALGIVAILAGVAISQLDALRARKP